MGNSYARVSAKRRTGVNTWAVAGAANPIDAGGQVDYVSPEALLGASSSVHFIWTNNSVNANQRTLTSANALQTAGTFNFGVSNARVQGISYDNAGTTKVIVWNGGGGATKYFDSGNTPTINTGTVPWAGSGIPNSLFNDGTDAWAMSDDGNLDIGVSKSTDSGNNWNGETVAFTATVSDTVAGLSIDGNIFTRGSSVVIPYIVNDNGTLKYNEYVVRTIAAAVTPEIFQFNQSVKRAAYY
jgi:hypothetical protein